jgi:hypothetical protein
VDDQEIVDGLSEETRIGPSAKEQAVLEALWRKRDEAIAATPDHKELLAQLEQDPKNVTTLIDGVDLGQQKSLYCFKSPEELQMLVIGGDEPQPDREGQLTEIVVRDVYTHRELHLYLRGRHIDSVAAEIEKKVRGSRAIKEGYLPFFIVMLVAFVNDNVRGDDFSDLLDRLANLYGDSMHSIYDVNEHKKARRRLRKYVKNQLARLVGGKPKDLPTRPLTDMRVCDYYGPPWSSVYSPRS